MAVIGAGPAGFYTAYRVMNRLPDAHVDMYESLPVPYGLVRYGVAPDHPEVKNCQDKFEEVAQFLNFTYIGNTPIGTSWPHEHRKSLPLKSIIPHYDAILFSYGASRDRLLGIPGEDTKKGIYSARAFVGWYNGLPEYRDLEPLLDKENAVVIGQGNVALDVARILLSDVDVLRKTDIAEHALQALANSKVKQVRVVGRRGPLQAAFTAKEVREQLSLPGVGYIPIPANLYPHDVSSLSRQQKRIMQILSKGSKTPLECSEANWELRFLLSPKEFCSSSSDNRLDSINFERNQLEQPWESPDAQATGTNEFESIPTDVAFRSIGYLSEPIPGLEELGVKFNDRRGLIPNEDGRVVRSKTSSEDYEPVHGVYTSGWVKRGPTGVIASTMYDAFGTADAIADDWISGRAFLSSPGEAVKKGWDAVQIEAKSYGIRSVNWEEWKKIDAAEKEQGKLSGKERVKFTTTDEMLSVLD